MFEHLKEKFPSFDFMQRKFDDLEIDVYKMDKARHYSFGEEYKMVRVLIQYKLSEVEKR